MRQGWRDAQRRQVSGLDGTTPRDLGLQSAERIVPCS